MSTLAIPNTFTAGAVITAAGHNQNMTAITNWAAGGIGADNLDTMSSVVDWNISSNEVGINMVNSGNVGSILITNNTNLASGNGCLKIVQNNTGPAILVNANSSGPAIQVDSTTSPVRLPRMTTTQRDLISAVEGDEIYNTTHKRKEIYNGSHWVAAAGNSGTIVNWPGATVPPHMVQCTGQTLAANGTNSYVISVVGTTYGASGTLPDPRGRAVIGEGTGSGLTNRVLGATVGAETHQITASEMPTHDHGFSGTTASNGDHSHNVNEVIYYAFDIVGNPGGTAGNGGSIQNPSFNFPTSTNGAHTHSFSGTTNSAGSSSTHPNMQPSIAMKVCIIL